LGGGREVVNRRGTQNEGMFMHLYGSFLRNEEEEAVIAAVSKLTLRRTKNPPFQ